MEQYLAGLFLFIGGHLFFAVARGARTGLISRLGEIGYKGLYSLIALAGLVLIIRGWSAWPEGAQTVLYTLPPFVRHITYLLVWAALILVASAYLPAGHIAARAKHPMVAGVKFWALGHLLMNGDLRSVLLFGSFLAFGVIDRIAAKKRGDEGRPAGPVRNDLLAIGVGTAAFVAILGWLHVYIAGVPLF
ncbi:MAG: NnrU family protein [Parvularcula sp.]